MTDSAVLRALWAGILLAPLAWMLNLTLGYLLVYVACSDGTSILLHLASLATLGIAVGGGLLAWRGWSHVGREWPGEGGSSASRARLMAALGMMVSALLGLVILAQWLPVLFLSPCVAA